MESLNRSMMPDRPNILYLFADQMHKFALGCMGTDDILTPNLDQLASEGILFKNSYSNCPVCTPYRINAFTGLYTSQTRTFRNCQRIPRKCYTMADAFNDGGYLTGFIGKWHIGGKGQGFIPKKFRGGFQEFIGYQCYNGFQNDVVFTDEKGTSHSFNQHRTDVTTAITIERLRKAAEDASKPFLMCVSFQAPHYPVQPSDEFAALYQGKRIKKRPNSQDIDPYVATGSPPSPKPKERDPDFRRYGGNLDEYLRLYYAMVSQIDAGVGKILAELDNLGIRDNTIVVFSADHGDMQGSHGMKNKNKPQEESSGNPLIFRVPGGEKDKIVEDPVSGVDLYPTFLSYAGISPKIELPGNNLAPTTMGDSPPIDKPAFSERPDWKMIRTKRYKLVVEGKRYVPKLMYDMETDPYEMNNLAKDPNHAGPIEELRNKLLVWKKYVKKNKVSFF